MVSCLMGDSTALASAIVRCCPKEMLLVEEVDNKGFLTGLFDVMYDELPTPKPKKKK